MKQHEDTSTEFLPFRTCWSPGGPGKTKQIKTTQRPSVFFLYLFLYLVLVYIIPSLIYRITFKATMLVYAPFTFVVELTLKNPLSLNLRLERITTGEIEKFIRWFSGIILALGAAKVGLIFGWVDPSYLAAKLPGQGFLESIVLPGGLPWWQVTLGIAAVLTFFLLFFADAALARMRGQQAWPDHTVAAAVSFVSFVRASLALATMAYFFHVAFLEVASSQVLDLLAT